VNPDGPPSTEARLATVIRTYGYTNTLDAEHYAKALRTDIRDGLTRTPKSTAPTWFYDARGSELFEQITQLRECPLWRAELGVFRIHTRDIAERTGARSPRGALLGE
jgi:L-histidine N-alpha-methyltransferase